MHIWETLPMHQRFRPIGVAGILSVAALLAACGGKGENKGSVSAGASATTATPSAPSTTPLTPAAGGHVITVELSSDEKGNYFTPREVTASQGDVIRFTLKVGVHNVHFLPDSNSAATGYPSGPSDLLQLPGQSVDVLVSFAPGTYYFQCDPHALLGMNGRLMVK